MQDEIELRETTPQQPIVPLHGRRAPIETEPLDVPQAATFVTFAARTLCVVCGNTKRDVRQSQMLECWGGPRHVWNDKEVRIKVETISESKVTKQTTQHA